MSKQTRFVAASIAAAMLAVPGAASAQLYLNSPDFQSGPVEPTDPLVGIALPGATPAEQRAQLLWNLRAGLNVSALACQSWPFLRTVANYNALLAHHSGELATAYTTLEGYFRRVNGRTGPRQFDIYSTQTYQNFVTTNAQMGFCQVASRLAKEALATRKGELTQLATARLRELRSSLRPAYDSYAFTRAPIRLTPIILAPIDCSRLPRRERRACEGRD